MEVDWFTVGAQVVNFVILFGLLAKFLYRPIVDAIDRREERIADRLAEAERREEEADGERREYEQLLEELRDEREKRREEMRREVEERRGKQMEEVRREVREARTNWYDRLDAEQRQFLEDFSDRIERQVFEMAREALEDLADVSVARKAIERFVERLRNEESAEIERLRTAITDDDFEVDVRSSFELDDGARGRIESALQALVDRELEVGFEVDPDLVAGVEVRAAGLRFGWNIRSYLDSLRRELDDATTEIRARKRATGAGQVAGEPGQTAGGVSEPESGADRPEGAS